MNGDQARSGVVEAELPSGGVVRVRVVEDAGGLGSVGRLSRVDLESALAPIGEVAAMIRERVAPFTPTRAAVEFGVSFSVQSGALTALVFDGKGEASLTVTLEWGREDEDAG